ncbi:acyltransferase [Auricularia subglabra TFB-10046 SS5]|nr:acyltransferase [Auricularia subglabra TFB-10046 SS5]
MWVLHRIIRRLARASIWSFFADVYVVGEENVPQDGPVIIVSTHHNMLIDPAVLSCTVPYKRVIHYWAKSTLFINPIARYILLATGNIPVDRRNKDNQVLFRGTFDALARNNVVALFPEGTSYTEPRIMQVKDGAAWTTMEYTKYLKNKPGTSKDQRITLVPAAIVYTNKAKYRSSIIVEFGKPIELSALEAEFLSGEEGSGRRAVKKLTQEIEHRLVDMSINAPDWETLFAARTARDLLWGSERAIKLPDFVPVSQTLVDLFATPNLPGPPSLRSKLLVYHSLLRATKLTNADLSSLPLPRELNPSQHNVPLPSRLSTLSLLLRDTVACGIRLPFFLLPLMVHAPAYYMARFGASLVPDEEETQAQNKVVFGLLLLMFIYPVLFLMLWALFWLSPAGAVIAAGLVWLFAIYHVRVIDDHYEHAKRLLATWRILVGVWLPKRWEIAFNNLAPYTELVLPPANPFLTPKPNPADTTNGTPVVPAPPPPPESDGDKDGKKKAKRPPRRRLVRHVLRARIECAKGLEQLLANLQREPMRVHASERLAATYGDGKGTRDSREVLAFLKARGAQIAGLRGSDIDEHHEWAALSSGDEHEGGTGTEKEDDIVWVPSSARSD